MSKSLTQCASRALRAYSNAHVPVPAVKCLAKLALSPNMTWRVSSLPGVRLAKYASARSQGARRCFSTTFRPAINATQQRTYQDPALDCALQRHERMHAPQPALHSEPSTRDPALERALQEHDRKLEQKHQSVLHRHPSTTLRSVINAGRQPVSQDPALARALERHEREDDYRPALRAEPSTRDPALERALERRDRELERQQGLRTANTSAAQERSGYPDTYICIEDTRRDGEIHWAVATGIVGISGLVGYALAQIGAEGEALVPEAKTAAVEQKVDAAKGGWMWKS